MDFIIAGAVDLHFSGEIIPRNEEDEKLKEQLYSQIGQLKVEIDWLKKKTGIKY